MATKRMTTTPDLSNLTIAILLSGWSSSPPKEGTPEPEHGFGGGLLTCFELGGLARLWHQHEVYLRATAARWGVQPRFRLGDRGPFFYGEYLAHGGQE